MRHSNLCKNNFSFLRVPVFEDLLSKQIRIKQMGSLYEAGLFYVKKIMDSVNGMKTLIMDEETSKMVSAVITQTEILSQNVFLVKRLVVKNKTYSYQDGNPKTLWSHCNEPSQAISAQ